jgi:hypothetical protein
LAHCSLFLVVIIALPVATPKELHNSASFAFGHFENSKNLCFLVQGWCSVDTVIQRLVGLMDMRSS